MEYTVTHPVRYSMRGSRVNYTARKTRFHVGIIIIVHVVLCPVLYWLDNTGIYFFICCSEIEGLGTLALDLCPKW